MIYIIRHGETDANAKGLIQGRSNFALNANGIRLAEITGKAMKGIHFEKAYSSPLDRAHQTAELVLKESGNEEVPILIDERIIEVNFGNWEQKSFRNIAEGNEEMSAELVAEFFENPRHMSRFPKGESIDELCERTQEFLKELAADPENWDKNILVATHGTALRAMLNFLYEDPEDFWHGHVPYNCAVNIVAADQDGCHLLEDDKTYYDRSDCVDWYAK